MKKTSKWKTAQKFERRWWRNYLKKKDPESYIDWKKKYWKDFLSNFNDSIRLGVKGPILDVGCGPAGVFMVLEKYNVDALDPLIDVYENELAIFEKHHYPHVNFYDNAIENMEVKNKYNTIFCLNALNHVSDIASSVSNIIDAGKPDCNIIISIDGHNYKLLKYLLKWMLVDILHPHQYDIYDYEKMLIENNCTIKKKIKLKRGLFFSYYIIIAKKRLD